MKRPSLAFPARERVGSRQYQYGVGKVATSNSTGPGQETESFPVPDLSREHA